MISNIIKDSILFPVFRELFDVDAAEATQDYGALGIDPKFVADFIDNKYFTDAEAADDFASAITHARSGNAVMTDGYGPELVTNGATDWILGQGWSVSSDGKTLTQDGSGSGTAEAIKFRPAGNNLETKMYVLSFFVDTTSSTDVLDGPGVVQSDLTAGRHTVNILGSASANALRFRPDGTALVISDVSVREMPVIKWAPHNLLTYSEEFDNSAWSTLGINLTSVTTDLPTGVSGTAYRVQDTDQGLLWQSLSLPVGSKHTVAVWAKRGGSVDNIFGLHIDGNLVSSQFTATSEWQLFEFETTIATGGSRSAGLIDFTGQVYDIIIWGMHLYRSDLGGMVDNPDQPLSRASYVPTTSSAKYLPRIGHHVYNGSAWVNEGVLAESEARTNLVTYSEDFTDSSWTKSASSVTKKTGIVAPDGSENVYHFQEDTNNFQHQLTTNLTAGTQVFSVFAKGDGSGRYLKLYGYGLGSAGEAPVFDVDNGIVYEPPTQTHFLSASIQDVGNGWYRCSLRADTDAGTGDPAFALVNATNSHGTVGYTGDGTSGVYLYGAQLEATSGQASSYIPTSGSTVTRAAETFTIPSANLPWPTPQSITGNVYSGTDPVNITGAHDFTPTIADDGSTKVVRVKWTQTINTGTRTRMRFRNAANSTDLRFKYYNGSGTFEEIIVTSTGLLWRQTENSVDVDISDITLEEINPLSVSIGMEGRMTYADEDVTNTATLWNWSADSDNRLFLRMRTDGTKTGQLQAFHEEGGTAKTASTGVTYFSPDVLVPYNSAMRSGSTFVNLAEGGVSLTTVAPTGLPDLSAEGLEMGHDYMGTIGTFRVWDKDLGDDGIVEATNPSLEPSLSLTFEGTGTNSFIVNDWSQ